MAPRSPKETCDVAEQYFTLVFKGDIRKLDFNPLKTEAGVYGLPWAAGKGNAFDEIESLHDEMDRLEALLPDHPQ